MHRPRPVPEAQSSDWTPPPWHAPPASARAPAARRARERDAVAARAGRRVAVSDPTRRVVLGLAIAPGLTGAIALLFSLASPLSGFGAIPLGLLLLIVIQVTSYAVTRGEASGPLARAWLTMTVTTVGLVPLLALQVALLREPYVALSRGSATPALIASAVVVGLLLVIAGWCAIGYWETPAEAALVFMPVALVVPAFIGLRTTIDQRVALEALAEASLLAAGATVIAWSLPRPARPLVPPAALAVQFVALWLTGRGPSVPSTSGGVVLALYVTMLVVTVLLVVVVPLVAAWLQRQALRAGARARRRHGRGDPVGLG